MTSGPLTLAFTLSPGEYRRAAFWQAVRMAWMLYAIGGFAVFMLFFTPFLPTLYSHGGTPPPFDGVLFAKSLLFPVGILVGLPALTWWLTRVQWNKSPSLKEELTFIFTDEAILVENSSATSRIAWGLVSQASQRAGAMLIFVGHTFHIIPDRVLSDPGTRERLLGILRAHVAKRDF